MNKIQYNFKFTTNGKLRLIHKKTGAPRDYLIINEKIEWGEMKTNQYHSKEVIDFFENVVKMRAFI